MSVSIDNVTKLDISLDKGNEGHCKFEARLKSGSNISHIQGDENNLKWSTLRNDYGTINSIEISIASGNGSEHKLSFSKASEDSIKIEYININTNGKRISNATFIVRDLDFKFGYMSVHDYLHIISGYCINFIYQIFSQIENPIGHAESPRPSSINQNENSYSGASPFELYDRVNAKHINPDNELFKKLKCAYINIPEDRYWDRLITITGDKDLLEIEFDRDGYKYFFLWPSSTYTEISKDRIILTNTYASNYYNWQKIEISAYRDAQKQKELSSPIGDNLKQKKYHITCIYKGKDGAKISYELDVDKIDYFKDRYNDKIHMSEIMDSNKHTLLDYIEYYLKRAKFIINYK
jgi:hypothetical protein